jgi:hemerythrin
MNLDLKINWGPPYEVGNPQLDKEHQELCEIMNELYDAGSAGIVRNLLEKLMYTTRDNFKAEEQLMLDCSYPAFERHKKLHDQLLLDLETLINRYTTRPFVLSKTVNIYLKSWLLDHIHDSDLKFTRWVQSHEKEASPRQ